MPRKKTAMPKGAGFVCPPLVAGPDPVAKGVAAAVLNARLRGPRSEGFPAAAAVDALPANGCKWPIGEVRQAGFRFCCEERTGDPRYCDTHVVASRAREQPASVRIRA